MRINIRRSFIQYQDMRIGEDGAGKADELALSLTQITATFLQDSLIALLQMHNEIMGALPAGSVVINATGMGKDTPGSPVSAAGIFPEDGVAWEFNYRGELDFLHQALAQQASRHLKVEDGWVYFLHGWTQVVAQVLHVELDKKRFEELRTAAESLGIASSNRK